MSQINAITGSIVQAPTVQRQQEMGKSQQIRQRQDRQKNAAASDEQEVEQSVASPDQVQPIANEQHGQPQRRKTYARRHPAEPEPPTDGESLDLTA
ncbi:MAG: hypothetical protein ABSD28_16235 [Tepidisphaeraceae bacterium]|jgi:hypothetical protein